MLMLKTWGGVVFDMFLEEWRDERTDVFIVDITEGV